MKFYRISLALVMAGTVGLACAAPSVRVMGTVSTTIPLDHAPTRGRMVLATRHHAVKQISLMRLKLSKSIRQAMDARRDEAQTTLTSTALNHYPRQIQLGMNGVPVLDQGTHGSCAVFAITGAIDAAMGQGDYISQLCQLELGHYLHNNSYTVSGWDGSWGQAIYAQIEMFGVIPKSLQATGACGGVLDYPLMGQNASAELSVVDFHQLSESIQDRNIIFTPLIVMDQIDSDFYDQNRLLYKIKGILNQGDRVTFGVLLDYNRGSVGALGTHHVNNDTWVLSTQIAEDFLVDESRFAGHAFVITGYDDDAIATDAVGRTYRGLLTLRNSWGNRVGDQGDFYMTYAHFKKFVLEAHHIRQQHQETTPVIDL